MRLNKALAAAGVCSRRKADELVLAGRVQVNGQIASSPGICVGPDDILALDGKNLARAQRLVHVMLHKPPACVCTLSDPEGRPTILDCLPPDLAGLRLFPVGRLDYFSEGLLIMTNDGQLAQRLAHPRYHQPKIYEVTLRGAVPREAIKTMAAGMRLAEGDEVMPIAVLAEKEYRGNTNLTLELRQGLNRQIRRMCRDLGLTILRLCRIAQACLKLGKLPAGQCRHLTASELAVLKKSVGL